MRITKYTDNKILNLFSVDYKNGKGKDIHWEFSSHNEEPLTANNGPIGVHIIPVVVRNGVKKVVVCREQRITTCDNNDISTAYAYTFPGGQIDKGDSIEKTIGKELLEETGLNLMAIRNIRESVYPSPGTCDVSIIVAFVEADGEISRDNQESTEDMEAFELDINEVRDIIYSNDKIELATYCVLQGFADAGKINI
jgi:ADP-ribose pyrophosphatase